MGPRELRIEVFDDYAIVTPLGFSGNLFVSQYAANISGNEIELGYNFKKEEGVETYQIFTINRTTGALRKFKRTTFRDQSGITYTVEMREIGECRKIAGLKF